jgi:hypothetical protein
MRTNKPSSTSASRRIFHCCVVHSELTLSKFHDTCNIFVATGNRHATEDMAQQTREFSSALGTEGALAEGSPVGIQGAAASGTL